MATSPGVETHRYVNEEETYAAFEAEFADDPAIIDLVEPNNLPTSFEVTFDDQADIAAIVAEIEAFDIVESAELDPDRSSCLAEVSAVTAACDQPPAELTIFLPANVDDATVEAVRAVLDRSPTVAQARYKDLDETLADFEEYWADDPEILDLVKPEQLPTSFAATVSDELLASTDWEQQIADLRAELRTIDVDIETDRAISDISEACWEAKNGDAVSELLTGSG